jgi:hypothetical protein
MATIFCHGYNIRLGAVEVEELAAVWRVDAASGGRRRIRVAYRTYRTVSRKIV